MLMRNFLPDTIKNGNTYFIQAIAIRERDFSIKLSSTPNAAKTTGDVQPMGRGKGSADGKLLGGTSFYIMAGRVLNKLAS